MIEVYLLTIALWHHSLVLQPDGSYVAPWNEVGEVCPWPIDPLLMTGQPIGQYHCPWCGAMVLAGVPHLDYGGD